MKITFVLKTAISALIVVLSAASNVHALVEEQRQLGGMMKAKSSSSKPSSDPSGRPSAEPSRAPSAPPSANPSKTPSAPPSAKPSVSLFPSSMPSQQCHPLDTLYDRFLASVRQCEAGADLSEAQEAYLSAQVSNLVDNLSTCVDNEAAVNKAIENNQTLILLCPHTSITLKSSIVSISGKEFEMRCLSAPSAAGVPSCEFNGNLTVPLFSPEINGQNVKFYGIRFTGGKSDFGGAFFFFYGNGGRAEFDSCQFDNNQVGGSGGAMYIGPGAVIVVTNSRFQTNTAAGGSGGAIFVRENLQLIIGNTAFAGNSAKDDGPNIFMLTNSAVVLCSFGNSFPFGEPEIFRFRDRATISCTY